MKKTLFILFMVSMLLLVNTISGYADQRDAAKIKAGSYDTKGELITVKAKGLVCDFCAKALEKVFLKQDVVSGINIDLTTKEILINLKKGKTLDDKTITKLINDSGYNIEEIIRSGSEIKDETHH